MAIDVEAGRLWPALLAAAGKGKLLPPADAEATIGSPDLDAVDRACAALQTWCWVRGMPPIDRLVAHPHTKGPVRMVADYDVFFEAIGADVTTERHVLAYPWRGVQEPTPADLALAARGMAGHGATLRAFRFLDLELELREAGAARGRSRPAPQGCATWAVAQASRGALVKELAAAGLAEPFLRPPGRSPYPPPAPRVSSYDH